MPEGHFLDVHRRKVLYESLYIEHLHTTVNFMVAVKEDEAKILEYLDKHNFDVKPDSIRQSLNSNLLILAADCFDICGMIVGKPVETANLNSEFEHIQNEITAFLKKHLPEECKEFVFVDLLSVREEYNKAGIDLRLWKELLKLANSSNIQFVVLANADKIPEVLNSSTNGLTTVTSNTGSKSSNLLVADLKQVDLTEPPPTLPEAYKLPNVKRQLLTKNYAHRLKCEIRYEIAVEEDLPVIKDLLVNEYFRQTMLTRTLQCRRQDGESLLMRLKTDSIKCGMTILAIIDGKLCGLFINARNVFTENDSRSTPHSPTFPDDFTREIDAQPFTHIGGKTVIAIGTWMTKHVGHYLPANCNEYFYMNMLGVCPHYRGLRIGYTLWIESLKLGYKLGYKYAQTICTAIASNKLAESSGMQKGLTVVYGDVKYKGQKLFADGTVYDGGREMIMWVGDLEKICAKLN